MRNLSVVLVLCTVLFFAACSDVKSSDKMGELDAQCYPNKTCNEGLSCEEESNLCKKIEDIAVDDSDDADSQNDDETSDTDTENADTESPDSADSQNDDDKADTSETTPGNDDSDDADTADSGNDSGDSQDDSDTDHGRKQGELYGECYPNETCNKGLVCDVENNICIKDISDSSDDSDSDTPDTTPDNDADTSDSGNDSVDTLPDDDADYDSVDPLPDEDADYDSVDTLPDEDADTDSGDTLPDEDADTDTEIVEPDPCDDVDCGGHGVCALLNGSAYCICDPGYHQDGDNPTECIADTDPCENIDCGGHGVCAVCGEDPCCICDMGSHLAINDPTQCILDYMTDPCESIDCGGHGVCALCGDDPCCICDSGYYSDINNDPTQCIAATQRAECSPKPDNTVWNDGNEGDEIGTFIQNLTDSGWEPAEYPSTYNNTEAGTCRYVCEEGYEWTGLSCDEPSVTNFITIGNICTGQKKCYNNSSEITCPTSTSADFYGQDAQFTSKCTAQSFTVGTGAQAGTVFDNNTGLTWENTPSPNTYIWDDRATYCNELNSSNYGGKSNWRVPNPLELLTIVDNSKNNPAVDPTVFPDMPADEKLWTNQKNNADTSKINAYFFQLSFGRIEASQYSSTISNHTFKVLCVSGNELIPTAPSYFITSSDGKTVTDNRTGLMWQKTYATEKTWQQALAYCQSLNTQNPPYAGYTDWRLPNKNELASLLDPRKSTTPTSNFPDMPSKSFWSSSSYDKNNVWVMSATYIIFGTSDNKFSVRCVR